jgi:cyclopropane fatty-acyl-phospholipid synthase-like methyltransferase
MTEFELLVDFHINAKRQGPGSHRDTLKALSFIDVDPGKTLKIADIGCGTGAQSIDLAKELNAEITAVDLFPEFLERLRANAKALGLEDKVTTLQKSMDDLPFSNEEFDIIWSEGAIYNMGFEKGIEQWKHFLKVDGYMALSEITWTTATRPAEIQQHWDTAYPEIDTASNKMQILEKHGFSPVGYFYLSESSWMDTYYKPMQERFGAFLKRHKHSETAKAIVEAEKDEIHKYLKYKEYYSYGFYVAKKVV